jgi:hypothetical protein
MSNEAQQFLNGGFTATELGGSSAMSKLNEILTSTYLHEGHYIERDIRFN